jgi:DNA polymerase-3 subunit delta'
MYPWLQQHWQQLVQRAKNERLPHALLISGPAGLGKHVFTERFAHYLLCDRPVGDAPCGECRSCTLLAAGSHPDYLAIEPEEPGKAIKIDQIRQLAAFTALTPQYGGHKLAIISPAEQMNRNAANSLLKTLEEPAGPTIMLLVTSKPHRLPATIRSRCQLVPVAVPDVAVGRGWLATQSVDNPDLLLALAEGAPLRAITLAEQDLPGLREQLLTELEALAAGQRDPVEIAGQWHKLSDSTPLYWFRQWIMDMIRLKSARAPAHLANPDIAGRLHKLAEKLDLVKLYRLLDGLNESLRLLGSSQVNPQLLTEEQLIRWQASAR